MKEDEKKPKPDDAGNAGKIAGQMMKKDTATALLFRNSRENFAGLFSRTVFSGTPVLPEELSEQDIKETAFLRIARQGGGTTLVQYRDVAMGLRRERLLAVLGLENQSLPDYAMPFRVLEVDFINYARQIQIIQDRHRSEWKGKDGHLHRPAKVNAGEYLGRFLKTDRIARCVTLVVYWGSEPWDGPMKLSDLFEDGEDPGDSVRLDMKLPDDGRGDLRLHRRTADRVRLLQIRGGQGRTEKIYRWKPGTFQQCFRNGDGRAGGTDPFPAAAADPDAGISDTGRRLQRVSGNSRND